MNDVTQIEKVTKNTKEIEKLGVQDQKFFRGQVWWLKGIEAHKHKIVNGEEVLDENGVRPVIIVSNNIVNRSKCSYLTVVPCTTNMDKDYICTNVAYTNYKGIRNCVETNQIMSVEKSKITDYISTLDEDVMKKIEQAIKIQTGMEEFKGHYFNKEKNRQTLLKVENVVPKVEDSQLALWVNEVNNNVKEKEKVKEKEQTVEISEEVWDLNEWKSQVAQGHIKWNVNREIEFIKLYENMGLKALAQEIGMKKQTVASKISRLRKEYTDIKRHRQSKKNIIA